MLKSGQAVVLNLLSKKVSPSLSRVCEDLKPNIIVMAKKRQLEDTNGESADLKKSKTKSKSEGSSKKSSNKSSSKEKFGIGTIIQTKCGPPFELTEPEPTRKNGVLVFKDSPEFRPNRTPKEVLQSGSFGGTYFRPIKSGVTGESYSRVWEELPKDWLEGLRIETRVSSKIYDTEVNKYKVKCGGSLEMWESSGWMHKQDPYGWFMWYCRYYRGRRTEDDERQISRWLKCAGEKGRWKNNLIAKVVRQGSTWDDVTVSPVVRQTLLHWGYELTEEDFKKGAKRVKV